MTTETLSTAVPATRDRIVWRVLAVTIGALLVALAAQVEIPLSFSPIPITLQGLAIVLVGLTLGPRYGAAALVTYLTAGLVGLPVFSGASFGFIKFLGPTGGYLVAFPFGAWVAGYIVTRGSQLGNPVRYVLAALAGMATIHAGGWAWLAIVTHDPVAAFRLGVLPFALLDPVKAILAAMIALGVGDRVRRAL